MLWSSEVCYLPYFSIFSFTVYYILWWALSGHILSKELFMCHCLCCMCFMASIHLLNDMEIYLKSLSDYAIHCGFCEFTENYSLIVTDRCSECRVLMFISLFLTVWRFMWIHAAYYNIWLTLRKRTQEDSVIYELLAPFAKSSFSDMDLITCLPFRKCCSLIALYKRSVFCLLVDFYPRIFYLMPHTFSVTNPLAMNLNFLLTHNY